MSALHHLSPNGGCRPKLLARKPPVEYATAELPGRRRPVADVSVASHAPHKPPCLKALLGVKMDRRGWLGVIGLIATGAAWSPAMGTDSNAKMQALAAQVVVASGNDARISAINRAYLERDKLKAALTTALPKDVSEQVISAAVETEIEFETEAFFKENVRIYSTHFSEAELRDMLAFYQSPGGKALVTQTPKIIQEKAAFGQQLGRDLVSRMVASACGGKSTCH